MISVVILGISSLVIILFLGFFILVSIRQSWWKEFGESITRLLNEIASKKLKEK